MGSLQHDLATSFSRGVASTLPPRSLSGKAQVIPVQSMTLQMSSIKIRYLGKKVQSCQTMQAGRRSNFGNIIWSLLVLSKTTDKEYLLVRRNSYSLVAICLSSRG